MSTVLSPARELGATGVKVPLIGYGTHAVGKQHISHEDAIRALHHALDRGITYFDTSPDYGTEPIVGEVMRTRRDEVFLATKINRRTDYKVLDDLKDSLRRLHTDHVDLIQVHSVAAWADLQQTLAPDGALVALEKARDEGLVRFIGITGHVRPDILGHAIEQYPFDTVLAALGIADRLITSPETFLLPKAIERNVGVIAMKVLGHGHYTNRRDCLRYSLGLPGVSLAIVGMENLQHIDEAIATAASFAPLSQEEEDALIEELKPIIIKDGKDSQKGKSDLFWLHDTSVFSWQHGDEPVLVEY